MPVKNRGNDTLPQSLSQAEMSATLPATPPANAGAAATTGPPVTAATQEVTEVGATPHELRILQALRRITRALELHSRELAAGYSVTGPQLVCLLAVKEKGPLTPTAIAYEIHLSSSTVVGILDRLEEKGLVHRERDRIDRRQVKVAATEKGLALASRAPSPLQETLAMALTRLPELERIAIALSLERVAGLMETRDLDTAPVRGASTRQRKSGGASSALEEEDR
jgi:DNA-binding MarR family transcriptional regulator